MTEAICCHFNPIDNLRVYGQSIREQMRVQWEKGTENPIVKLINQRNQFDRRNTGDRNKRKQQPNPSGAEITSKEKK